MLYLATPQTSRMSSVDTKQSTTTTTIVEGVNTTTTTITMQIPGEGNKFNRRTEQTVVTVTNIELNQCEICKDFNNRGNNVYCKCYAKCDNCGKEVYNGEECECQICCYCDGKIYDDECENCD